MRLHRIARTVAVAVASCVLPATVATSAQAVELEEDYGSLTTEICDDTWRGGTAPPFHEPGWACFERSGDKFLVNVGDTVDGSPRVEWWNELKNARGDWKIYRQGYCYGEWYRHSTVVCNKNFYEDSTSPNALGGKGSRIVFLYRDSHGPSAKAVVLNDG